MRRKSRSLGLVLVALCLALSGSARTQTLDEPTVVEDLIVKPSESGPAWWRISRGESVVWVLGMPSFPIPGDLPWDSLQLDRRMDGARYLITPPVIALSAANLNDLFRGKVEPPDHWPEPLKSRFLNARSRYPQPPGRTDLSYRRTALALGEDFLDATGLQTGQPLGAVLSFAARRGVTVRSAATHDAVPEAANPPRQASPPNGAETICLYWAIQDVEQGPERYRSAARAWAEGDIRAALSVQRAYPRECVPSWGWRRVSDDYVRAISRALRSPGKVVAVVPLRWMVAEGGVLQTLKARGYEIRDPSRLAEPSAEGR